MKRQYKVLGYRIDLQFYDYKLEIEIDENGNSGGNTDYEIKRKKATEKEIGCKFSRIDLDKRRLWYF